MPKIFEYLGIIMMSYSNEHELVHVQVTINYYAKIVFIKFIGTHKQYDKINIEEL